MSFAVMSLVRNISNVLRISSAYKPPISWTRVMSSTPTIKPEEPKPTPAGVDHTKNRATHRPDNLEKKFLVWTGKYKTVDEVPEYIK